MPGNSPYHRARVWPANSIDWRPSRGTSRGRQPQLAASVEFPAKLSSAGGPSAPGALISNWIGSREHWGLECKPVPCLAILELRAPVFLRNHGNKSFAVLVDHVKVQRGIQQVIPVDPRDLGLVPGSRETGKQRPFAAILGCSDARAPVELIFNEGPNDLFVIRVAGNGLGTEALGSLKYEAIVRSRRIASYINPDNCRSTMGLS
ncbi:carbonic anhydrase [Bradyrhizobium barranii]|uniref:carbonic anhydrase n=1 Tax=Bradyrhizobium barranii TaxID=2992140 RepID=UPI003133B73B